ncbi:hypothetical protein GCM10009715_00210 [Paeniglutamicibacter psychrophenolicus]
MGVAEPRAGLSDAMSRAAFGHERIVITHRGKIAAVLIGPEDQESLEQLDDRQDLVALRQAREEDDGERIGLDEVLAANGMTR